MERGNEKSFDSFVGKHDKNVTNVAENVSGILIFISSMRYNRSMILTDLME
ncbi:MAG: hypothetical protein IJ381_04000 [Clostridia bacterium]|nr:hypothetical protein [Clostridia bacterium]